MSNGTSEAGRGMFAFGLGVIVGSVGALLLAPASGQETRRRLGSMAHRIGEETRHRLDDAKHYVGDKVEEAKDFVNERKSRLETALEEGRQAYRREAGKAPTGGRESEL